MNKKKYPIIKPIRPRTKEDPITITNELHPQAGQLCGQLVYDVLLAASFQDWHKLALHREAKNFLKHLRSPSAFEVSITTSYQEWKSLSKFAHKNPKSFLTYFRKEFLQSVIKSEIKTRTIKKIGTFFLRSACQVNLTVRATPRDWCSLANYVKESPQVFVNEFQDKFLSWLSDFEIVYLMEGYLSRNPRGPKADASATIQKIRRLATSIYFISKYWLSRSEEEWPPLFKKYVYAIRNSPDQDYIFDARDEYDPRGIAYVCVKSSQLGRKAIEQGVALEKGVRLFRKTYISNDLTKLLKSFFKRFADCQVNTQKHVDFTNSWFGHLPSNRSSATMPMSIKKSCKSSRKKNL